MLNKNFLPLYFSLLFFTGTICIAQQPKLILPIGHTKEINSAQFSPDGKRIVTASSDKTAKIWDVASGNLLLNLKGSSGEVTSAEFSRDGKNILTTSDSTARIWDAETGKVLKEIKDTAGMIRFAGLSPDGKRMLALSLFDSVKIWDLGSGRVLFTIDGKQKSVESVQYSPDGKRILTLSNIYYAKIWDAETGKFLFELNGNKDRFRSARYSPDGKNILTISTTDSAKIWDAETGKFLFEMNEIRNGFRYTQYSQEGKKFPTYSIDNSARVMDVSADNFLTLESDNNVRICDMNTGKISSVLKGHTSEIQTLQFSPDGNKIISSGFSDYNKPPTSWVWDLVSGKLSPPVKKDTATHNIILYSPDGKKVVTTKIIYSGEDSWPDDIKIWDVASGKLVSKFNDSDFYKGIIKFSPDGKKILTVPEGLNSPIIWDVNTGKQLVKLKSGYSRIYTIQFSKDGKKIMTTSLEGSLQEFELKIWDAVTGKVLKKFSEFKGRMVDAQISPDGKKMMIASMDAEPGVWDFATYKRLFYLKGSGYITFMEYSPDGNKIVTASYDTSINSNIYTIKIWNALTGKLLVTTNTFTEGISAVHFSPDSKKILATSYADKEKNVKVWDVATGNLFIELRGHDDIINDALFSPDGKYIATASGDNTIKKWDAVTGKCLYTFFAVDKEDYLVVDNDNHYDGTEAGRKLLYFVCGTEIVDLAQVKDQLWVPDLAERINKAETINAKTLDELNICGLTPLVEEIRDNTEEFHFTIKPRRGGLGDLNLSINGVIADTRKPEQLTRKDSVYELRIVKSEFIPFLPDGQINKISLKANTADNAVSSREIIITIDKTEKPAPPPNLYGVMVGISDYKGDKMDLGFAAIDATDMSNALADAAGKLLGKEHVFMYNLTTAKEHYLFPEKNSIKKVFEEIGKKATANDILFIFFSGHGVMEGEGKKQFYYMTADASDFDEYALAGISTTELTEWIKPQNIRAQKRILVLDACHSGQAINDFVKLGDENQGFLASKGDDKAQQVKAIDKLNERSGLFILSASAGDKLSFESQARAHGYLTYSLLKTIKEQPDILEDGKFLNISRWFNATENTVDQVSKEEGVSQQTQIVTTTDFNIGLVDDQVTGKIKLSEGKQVFSASNFQNSDVIISDDDLDLARLINAELASVSSKGAESKIMFNPSARSPEAYRLSGRYIVKGNSVSVTVNIRQNNILKTRFVLNGTTDKLDELASTIVKKAEEWVVANKKP